MNLRYLELLLHLKRVQIFCDSKQQHAQRLKNGGEKIYVVNTYYLLKLREIRSIYFWGWCHLQSF